MRVTILRGQNQIGGSIIEVKSYTTSLIVEVGSELSASENRVLFDVPGLFSGQAAYSAVLISHYHADHVGLMNKVLPGIPLFMGEKCYKVMQAVARYKNQEIGTMPRFFESQAPFTIGDITITSYLCDHSAFDAYMFLFEADGRKVLYSGDFRANGRKSFPSLLHRLPKVDALIVEGTTLARDTENKNLSESDLQSYAEQIMRHTDGPAFIYQSAMNVDRLVTLHKASYNCGRVFLEDIYAAEITSAIGGNIPNPVTFPKENLRVFKAPSARNLDEYHYEMLQKYPNHKIGRRDISNLKFSMLIRPSMKNYLTKLAKLMDFTDGVLFYSMWSGYLKQGNTKEFIESMEDLGLRIIQLHTSGHADVDSIMKLIDKVNPSILIPVHTENSLWFANKYTDKQVLLDRKQICI